MICECACGKPFFDDICPFLRLIYKVPQVIIRDNNSIGFFSVLQHESVTDSRSKYSLKVYSTTVEFNKHSIHSSTELDFETGLGFMLVMKHVAPQVILFQATVVQSDPQNGWAASSKHVYNQTINAILRHYIEFSFKKIVLKLLDKICVIFL